MESSALFYKITNASESHRSFQSEHTIQKGMSHFL